ncbi:hypothetical protein E4U42_007138 [Claviceps africana]|uniref:Uncharacterized protein n=1 Tax=Claviceps africana TaxID=83212 RepID=A0A8K0JBL7_9HYPO|nr:hypothetical protein E4U42_007138 [Claviceps africana]
MLHPTLAWRQHILSQFNGGSSPAPSPLRPFTFPFTLHGAHRLAQQELGGSYVESWLAQYILPPACHCHLRTGRHNAQLDGTVGRSFAQSSDATLQPQAGNLELAISRLQPCNLELATRRHSVFRILGDLSHLASKGILIFSIHRNRSAEGVSLITQGLYALVFCTRYLDIFREKILWNLLFKIVYIVSSLYTIAAMQWVFPRSRERELSWKMGAGVLTVAAVLSPFMMMIFEKKWSFRVWMWVFSQILESGCVLPQLLLLRQTTVPTVINSFYLLALGSYRALYILNWFVRELDVNHRKPDAVAVIFGCIQTALYVDFAWVYYTRQRVKLRGGGIVDADDMRRGWLLSRIFGKRFEPHDDDEESTPALGDHGHAQESRRPARPGWGARGISISADEDVFDQDGHHGDDGLQGRVDPDAKMQDPDELAKALDDDDDDDDDDDEEDGASATASSSSKLSKGASFPNGIRSGDEWRD